MQIVVAVLAVFGLLILGIVAFAFTGRDRAVLFGRSESIEVNGLRRTFLVSKGGALARDLVIGLHGYGGDGRQLAYYTALHNSFGSNTIVVYPNATKPKSGQKTGWNADFVAAAAGRTTLTMWDFSKP